MKEVTLKQMIALEVSYVPVMQKSMVSLTVIEIVFLIRFPLSTVRKETATNARKER